MSSVWRYLQLDELFRIEGERDDPNTDLSLDVKTTEYPNYNVIPDYDYNPPPLAGTHVLMGFGYGFMFGSFLAFPLLHRKYRKQGYRDFYLLERICIPLIKWTFGAALIGIAIGSVFEVKRILDQDERIPYNQKIKRPR